ncbi:FAD/NAD(P)-binding domain-containing protein [Mycena amicta]|nr:FAD/NAD(P)-binding domain-containing protein [Mycena amicta]
MSASVAGISTQEALQIATEWLGRLDTAVSNVDVEAFAEQILATGWLRDFLCFSWDFRTISGRANIAAFLAESSRFTHAGLHALTLQVTSSLGPPTPFPPTAEPRQQESPEAYTEDIWEELHAKRVAEIERDPTVLIGTDSFLLLAIRAYWTTYIHRYPNLSLHTPGYHSYMLYHPWPTTFPKFLPKQKIGDFLEGYAIGQDLVVWVSTEIASQPVFDNATGRWRVEVNRAGDKVSLSPRHVVLAVGTVGKPKIPQWPGMSHFRGTMYHSDEHKGAAPFAGKRVVVVGACNSGADMCQDFVLKGAAEVTMVQRSATCVLSARTADTALFRGQYPLQYSATDADFANNATPPALLLRMAVGITQRLKGIDRELHDGLAKAGMKLTWEMTPGGGEVGLLGFLFDRVASGTLMDMGCGQLIIDGKVKIKQGVEITHIDPDGVVFADGSKIEADVVVLATGYTPIIDHYTAIFGRNSEHPSAEMQVWGMDHEGEIRRAYRPSGVPKLWFALGAFQQVRFMSKHLAIQILAEELGLKDV